MEECIFFPSPNWFQTSGLCVTRDGWLIYGGPYNSLCVIEPLPPNTTGIVHGDRYGAYFLLKAHPKSAQIPESNIRRIVSVDINPEWPEKKLILSGNLDGTVKQLMLELIDKKYAFKPTHSHDVHKNMNEEVVGVGYTNESCALSVGSSGNIVKWDLNSNVLKTYVTFLRGFKPTCMSCSPHISLNMAVGTKQGVLFVLDLNGEGKILYKVRCHDDEILNLSWCPQYEVPFKKPLVQSAKRVSANDRMAKIRQEVASSENLNESFATKKLPDDSFDQSIVAEDDTFDIYTDHEMDLFGPNKYQPETVLVKVKKEIPVDDNFLAECMKLKEVIVKGKTENQADMASLVDAMEKTHVENEQKNLTDTSQDGNDVAESSDVKENDNLVEPLKKKDVYNEDKEHEGSINKGNTENVDLAQSFEEENVENGHSDVASGGDLNVKKNENYQVHRHIIATIGKQGAVRIWSKIGQQIASCNVFNAGNKKQKNPVVYKTLYWHTVDCLLVANGRKELLQCDPLKLDGKSKMEYHVVHALHNRGLFCIASDAPRVQLSVDNNKTDTLNNWNIWTVGQDRSLIKYSPESQKITRSESCGGCIYMIQPCPYDAKKIAFAVGDGAVRVWEADTADEDDTKLCRGTVTSYWQNVQGKVLSIAWHPTKENVLAFATAENRVGLIETSGRCERAARTFVPALAHGVYSLCWGEGNTLYACGGKRMVAYDAERVDEQPKTVNISLEGHQWAVACVSRFHDGLLVVGSATGAVAIVDDSYKVLAANYVHTGMLYNVESHPQQTTESNDKSPYSNLIAVTAKTDKEHSITILEYVDKEDGTKQLQKWKVLLGHKNTVHQLAWNPHRDELLVSTSLDCTVRVWDITQGVCVSIFGHPRFTNGVAWAQQPSMHDVVLSGGADCTVRAWRYTDHPPEAFTGTENVPPVRINKKKSRSKKDDNITAGDQTAEIVEDDVPQAHIAVPEKAKFSKKYLLPIVSKQLMNSSIQGARKMVQNYIDSNARCVDGKIETPFFNSERNMNIKFNKDENPKYSSDNKDASPDKDLSTEIVDKDSNSEVLDEELSTEIKDENNVEDEKGIDDGIDFIKIFGTTNDVNDVLNMEMKHHLEIGSFDAWIMLCILRGHIDTMMQFASAKDIICPYLVSITPCVSFKYWKDATQMYLAQIDRVIARGEEERPYLCKNYGGTVYRKVGSLLSVHDIKGAVETLLGAGLYKEAYILCRTRHMDSIAQETLQKWATSCNLSGKYTISAICYLALGELSKAVSILNKTNKKEQLCLAADIAKLAGHTTYATQIEEKTSNMKLKENIIENEDSLGELPTRMELLLRKNTDDINELSTNGDSEKAIDETLVTENEKGKE